MKIKVSNVNTPNWKEVTVKSRIPEELEHGILKRLNCLEI